MEYRNVQKRCDLLGKQPSGSLPLGTVDLNSVPLAKPAPAIKPICGRVWSPKEMFLTIQQSIVITSYMQYLTKVSHTLNKAELNPSLCFMTIFQLADPFQSFWYFVVQLPSLNIAKLSVFV